MARRFDFGDIVTGTVCDADTGKVVRPVAVRTGYVVGVLPALPKVATIRTGTGITYTVRVSAP